MSGTTQNWKNWLDCNSSTLFQAFGTDLGMELMGVAMVKSQVNDGNRFIKKKNKKFYFIGVYAVNHFTATN